MTRLPHTPAGPRTTAALVLALALFTALLAGTAARPAAADPPNLGPLTPRDVVYQIITDRFDDGDAANNVPAGFDSSLYDGTGTDLKLYQGGDWQGVIDRIGYLKGMGVTAVWISAPYANRDTVIEDHQPGGGVDRWTSFHGYHARNYFTTNKHFGTLEEFGDLRDALHAEGIKLVVDFVTNHTSRWQNPTLGYAAEDGLLYEPDRDAGGTFCFDSTGEPYDCSGDSQVENLVADPHNDTNGWFHGIGDRGGDGSRFGYRHKDLGSLADFSQENAQVVAYLEDAAGFWKAQGVDGFRHDATLHMNPAFTKGLRDAIDSADGGPVSHFGEFFIGRPDPKYDEYRTFPDRTGVNNLDFEYFRAATNTFGHFSESMADFGNMMLATHGDYAYEHQAVTFIDNHDVTRFRYIQPNDKPYHAGLATLLLSRGTPNIYYGTEQYVTSADASDIAGRVFMETETTFDTTTAAYQLIGALAGLRQSNEALAYGLTSVLYSSSDVLVFQRQFYDHRVVAAVNRRPDVSYSVPWLHTGLPDSTYGDELGGLLGGGSASVSSGGWMASFTLDPGEVSVWSSDPAPPSTPRIGDVVSTHARAGSTLVISGTGLDGSVGVKVDGVAASVLSNSAERIEAVVPGGVAAGPADVTVTKGGATSNAFTIEVLGGDQVQVIFKIDETTTWGQNIHVVGSIPELGSWDPAHASEAMLNPNYPEWFLPVSVPAGTTFDFKFIKKDGSGAVTWEGGSNRVLTSPSSTTGTMDTPVYSWQ